MIKQPKVTRSITAAFMPGYVHVAKRAAGVDEDTGGPVFQRTETAGRGLIQSRPTGQVEAGAHGLVVDKRLVLFSPVVDVAPEDIFYTANGRAWVAVGEGYLRGLDQVAAHYVVAEVRRAPEYDR